MALTELPIRSRDITKTTSGTRVTRRFWALSTDVTAGGDGWVISGMPDFGDRLNLSGFSWPTNAEPVCVLSKVIPRGSKKRAMAFAIYQGSRML